MSLKLAAASVLTEEPFSPTSTRTVFNVKYWFRLDHWHKVGWQKAKEETKLSKENRSAIITE